MGDARLPAGRRLSRLARSRSVGAITPSEHRGLIRGDRRDASGGARLVLTQSRPTRSGADADWDCRANANDLVCRMPSWAVTTHAGGARPDRYVRRGSVDGSTVHRPSLNSFRATASREYSTADLPCARDSTDHATGLWNGNFPVHPREPRCGVRVRRRDRVMLSRVGPALV